MLELGDLCRRNHARCSDAIAENSGDILSTGRRLAIAELDYLAAKEGDSRRFWSCADAAYRFLIDTDPAEAAFVAPGSRHFATSLYGACLDRALAGVIADRSDLPGQIESGPYRIAIDWPAAAHSAVQMQSAAEIDVRGFRNHQRQAGVGAPWVVLLEPGTQSAGALVPAEGISLPVTAVAEFVEGATAGTIDAVVRFHDPYHEAVARLGSATEPLAADYTAPFALLAEAMATTEDRFLRLLRPGERTDLPILFAVTPYDPDRVTVVMIHGLGSSPLVWLDLTNDLLGDPRLRSKIQIWYCRYASGYPMLYNRALIAERLDAARRRVDPELGDRGTDDVVLIGHSMGGVIARLLVSSSGDTLWNAAFPGAASGLAGDPNDIAAARRLFDFEALPYVRRAVFVAAPQRGAPSAAGVPGWMLKSLIRLPPSTFDYLERLVRDNPGAVNPVLTASFDAGGPASVDFLSPDHPIIRALADLPIAPDVPYHVVSGTGWPVGGEPGDGFVPVWSTLLDGAESTLLVRTTHDVQRDPRAILEIKRILREHAGAPRARDVARDVDGR
jgi:pimeloyl-ACP methyl ester carboxylesterase